MNFVVSDDPAMKVTIPNEPLVFENLKTWDELWEEMYERVTKDNPLPAVEEHLVALLRLGCEIRGTDDGYEVIPTDEQNQEYLAWLAKNEAK